MRTVVFKHKNNPKMEIVVEAHPNMRIIAISNPRKLHFPYRVGQLLDMGHTVWACNNNYLVNGRSTCPEEKIFGIRVKDIPQGHELRHIYPNKFR